MGDNYCDSVNNRAFCNYDGGDCCQSTVKTKKVSGMLVPQSKPHPSDKEMMLDLLVTLIHSQCLFPNSGVTQSLGINPTSQMWSFFPFPVPNPLGILRFLAAMHPVEVAIDIYKWSFLPTHGRYNGNYNWYTVEDCCISPLGTSLNGFFLPLLCVQP